MDGRPATQHSCPLVRPSCGNHAGASSPRPPPPPRPTPPPPHGPSTRQPTQLPAGVPLLRQPRSRILARPHTAPAMHQRPATQHSCPLVAPAAATTRLDPHPAPHHPGPMHGRPATQHSYRLVRPAPCPWPDAPPPDTATCWCARCGNYAVGSTPGPHTAPAEGPASPPPRQPGRIGAQRPLSAAFRARDCNPPPYWALPCARRPAVGED